MREKMKKMPFWMLVVTVVAAPPSFAESSNGDWSAMVARQHRLNTLPLIKLIRTLSRILG